MKPRVLAQDLLQALPSLRRAQLAQQLPAALRAPLSLAAANGASGAPPGAPARHRTVLLTSCMEERPKWGAKNHRKDENPMGWQMDNEVGKWSLDQHRKK